MIGEDMAAQSRSDRIDARSALRLPSPHPSNQIHVTITTVRGEEGHRVKCVHVVEAPAQANALG